MLTIQPTRSNFLLNNFFLFIKSFVVKRLNDTKTMSLTTIEQSITNFVQKEISLIKGDATTIEADLENAANIGINITNALKNYIASPTGQDIVAIISAIPGVGPIASQVINALPQILVDLGHAQFEFTKSPLQVVQDGLTSMVNAPTSNVKATNLTTLASHVATTVSTVLGKAASIQSMIALVTSLYSNTATK